MHTRSENATIERSFTYLETLLTRLLTVPVVPLTTPFHDPLPRENFCAHHYYVNVEDKLQFGASKAYRSCEFNAHMHAVSNLWEFVTMNIYKCLYYYFYRFTIK